jgi:hypothetical protein
LLPFTGFALEAIAVMACGGLDATAAQDVGGNNVAPARDFRLSDCKSISYRHVKLRSRTVIVQQSQNDYDLQASILILFS